MEKYLYHPLTIIIAFAVLVTVATDDLGLAATTFAGGLVVWLVASAIRHKRSSDSNKP